MPEISKVIICHISRVTAACFMTGVEIYIYKVSLNNKKKRRKTEKKRNLNLALILFEKFQGVLIYFYFCYYREPEMRNGLHGDGK